MLEKAKELFSEYKLNNVVYCHWKSNEHLCEGLCGDTDLDILVSKNSSEISENVLKKCGYKKANIQFGSRYPDVEEWIGFDADTGKLIHVHLHYALITGHKHIKEFVFPWENYVLDSRIYDAETGVYICAPAIELVILKCRALLKMTYKRYLRAAMGKDGKFSKDFITEIEYLNEKTTEKDVKNAADIMFGGSAKALYPYFTGNITSYKKALPYRKIITSYLKPYRKFGSVSVLCRTLYIKLSFGVKKVLRKLGLYIPIYRKTLSEQGALIAFIGADGCGKSTVTSNTQKWLNWKLEAKRFYLGSGDHYNPLSKRIMDKLISKKGSSSNEKLPAEENKKAEISKPQNSKVGLVKTLAHIYDSYFLIAVAKHCLKELKRAFAYKQKGGIALFDRYPQTQFEGINDGPKIAFKYLEKHNNILFKFMAKREYKLFEKISTYSADVVIKLYVSPEESLRRKPDHNYSEVAKKAEIIDKLVFPKSKLYVVNTEQELQNEITEIRRIVWENL